MRFRKRTGLTTDEQEQGARIFGDQLSSIIEINKLREIAVVLT